MSDGVTAPSRIGLSLVVFIANAFLLVTLIAAALGLLDDLVLKSSLESQVFTLRGQIGGLNLVLTLIVLAALILVPHLPKLTLLPPLLVLIWQFIGAPGLSWSMHDHASMATLDAILLAAAGVGLSMNKLSFGSWFIRAADLPFIENLTRRTIFAAPIAAIALFTVSLVVLIGAVPIFLEQQSRGYLHFGSQGLEVRETILRKGNQEVHLVGMVHIGEPAFYRDLYASIPAHALILAEGVTDREGRMKAKPSYENAARGLGLGSQGEFQSLLASAKKVSAETDPTAPSPNGAAPNALPVQSTQNAPFVVFADIDVSELSPVTLRFLEAAGSIFQSDSLSEALSRYLDIANKFTEQEIKAVMDEIVLKRNAKALSEFDKYDDRFKLIYLPWGALHMPDFEDKILARGYTIQSSRMLQIAKYDTIFKALTANTPQAPKPSAATTAPARAY